VSPAEPAAEASRTRLILYVGKGGVGKTTLAAGTAALAARRGQRTLVVSTDLAHSLGDVLDVPLTAEPLRIADRLEAQEVNVLEEVRRSWGKVQDRLSELLRQEGMSQVQADELAIIPGMEEVAGLMQIDRKVRSGSYDCIVVDAAPTGETIRLLSMPESFQWYAGRLEQWRGRLMRLAGPLLSGLIPDLDVVDVMSQVAERVRALRARLTDPRQSSYRIVVTPDRTVLREAQRAETYLNLFDYPVDAVVVNRVLDPSGIPSADGYPRPLLERQARALAGIHDAFGALPIFHAPLSVEEPIGVQALARLAAAAFGKTDPTAILHTGATQRIERQGDGYVLRLLMPNVEVDRLALTKRGDELYVDVGNFRREVTLPLTLAALEPGTARIRSGMLEIPFAPAPAEAAAVP
jgi:arsenite/tail-anchored protein-transporting ATPase